MSHPAGAFPFAYLLPTDPARQVGDTDPARVTAGSPRRRLIVLVLAFLALALAGGPAATLPSGEARAVVGHECRYDPGGDPNSADDPLSCS